MGYYRQGEYRLQRQTTYDQTYEGYWTASEGGQAAITRSCAAAGLSLNNPILNIGCLVIGLELCFHRKTPFRLSLSIGEP